MGVGTRGEQGEETGVGARECKVWKEGLGRGGGAWVRGRARWGDLSLRGEGIRELWGVGREEGALGVKRKMGGP